MVKKIWNGLFEDTDIPKPVTLNPQPITTPSPEPEPWLQTKLWGEQSDLYGYGSDILPAGGIGYALRAPGGQSEEMCNNPQSAPLPTQTPIEEQIQEANENSNIDICENPYARFTMDDYDVLLGFAGESKNYEGFVAVAYCVLNRAIKYNKSIAEIGATGEFSAYKSEYNIDEVEKDVKRAAHDVLTGAVENPIGDAYFFFGVYKGYDIWVQLGECSYVKVVKGNVFYSHDGWEKVHNKKPISDFDPEKQLVIYNVSLESNKWIYDGLIIENGKVVVDRNVEEEAK